MTKKEVLKMNGISKDYSGNSVLKNISLTLHEGEILGLLGENGAGKSTLMNILFGMEVIHSTGGYQGDILISGEKSNITTPQMAMELGIGMVHQEFMLIPGFTVTENIKLNREISKKTIFSTLFGKSLEVLDTNVMKKDARLALDKVGLNLDENQKIEGMPVGYMQFIEIAREIDKTNLKILVFDEPTAVLTESEADRLLKTMKNIAKSGIAIIFITHRLDEVMNVCDTITILRDGEHIKDLLTSKTNPTELAELMVGREINYAKSSKDKKISAKNAIKLSNFSVFMAGENIKKLDLEIKKGEIFGIGGLAGQGKLGICNGIMGIYPTAGNCEIFDENINTNKLGEALHKKVAFVSEDRRGVGLLLDSSIADNICFNALEVNDRFLYRFKISKLNFSFFTIKKNFEINNYADKMIKELDIRCTGRKQKVGRLSGGNQQKVCLAKALAQEPKCLLVAEPTRGIDIGAKNLVLDLLTKLNTEQGMTIVMVSSELAELKSICDRIAIITDGKLAKILKPTDSDADFGLAMSGLIKVGGKNNE